MGNETAQREESFVETRVTYTLEMNGKLLVVENVPARVDLETGEQLFSPETVERLEEIVQGQEKPVRFLETPVFDYAACPSPPPQLRDHPRRGSAVPRAAVGIFRHPLRALRHRSCSDPRRLTQRSSSWYSPSSSCESGWAVAIVFP